MICMKLWLIWALGCYHKSSKLAERRSEIKRENKPRGDLLQKHGSRELIAGILYSDVCAGMSELFHVTDNAEVSLWSHFFIQV